MISNRRNQVKATALMLLYACLAGCSSAPPSIEAGSRAPEFALPNLSGERVSLNDLREKGVVLMNFWASWCSPCKAEVPILNKIHQDFQNKGLTVVGISEEDRKDMVASFRRKHDVQYTILLDSDGKVAKRYGLYALPMTVLVDRSGTVLLRKYGVIDEETMGALEGKLRASR